MSILLVCHLRRALNFKLCSQPRSLQNYLPLFQSPVGTVFLNKQHCISPTRHFSWDGLYYSISTSTPVLTLQNALVDFHNFSGLPWWAVIMLATLGIRSVCVFPFAVHQNQVTARLINMHAELGKMAPELNKEVNIAAKMYGWDEPLAKKVFKKSMREHYQKFILRDNCHPFKVALLAIFQIPVWFFFSVSLRNLTLNQWTMNFDTQLLHQQLQSEGILWFTDLTVPDICFIPILIGAVNLTVIEIHALRKVGKSSKFQKTLLYASRFIAITVAGAATLNPTSVTFYWLCSSLFGLTQNLILMSPRCRRILRVPNTMSESSTPFADVALNFKKRFRF